MTPSTQTNADSGQDGYAYKGEQRCDDRHCEKPATHAAVSGRRSKLILTTSREMCETCARFKSDEVRELPGRANPDRMDKTVVTGATA